MVWLKVKENIMEGKDSIKDNGIGIHNMDLAKKSGGIGKVIRDIIKTDINMEKAFINGLINHFIREIGFRGGFRGKVSMFIRMDALIKDSLLIT